MNMPFPSLRAWWSPAGIVMLVAASLVLAACSESRSSVSAGKSAGGDRPVPVTVATVEQRSLPVQIRSIGSVEAYATVAVKARVDGQIVRVGFTEGQDVEAGQVLFQIDPRPFEAEIKRAEADLARDRAKLDFARTESKRLTGLRKGNFVSQEAYAQAESNLEAAEATVTADEAALESLRLQLEFTTVRSPIEGRTGRILIQEGNLVKANDTNPLVVINQVNPVFVTFSVPERRLTEITKRMGSGALRVDAVVSDASQTPQSGVLTFVDNAVDPTTGTIKLKATFGNEQRLLWPGQFVTAILTLREQPDAVVIPSHAIGNGPGGAYVFVVTAAGTVEVRPVVVSREAGELSVIRKGLAPGERVVVSGQLRLKAGTKVDILAAATPQ